MRCQDPIVAGATRRREGAECVHSCPRRGTVGRVRPVRHRGREGRLIPITDLGDALEAFILEHEYCGELDSAVEDDRVWMTCTCGAAGTWTAIDTARRIRKCATGTGWERTPWHATQRAAWEALRRASADA
jgi:hypothetical protein